MKKLCAAIGDHVQEVEFCQQEREQLLRWMKRRFAAEGHDIDIAAADHLLFTCGTELVRQLQLAGVEMTRETLVKIERGTQHIQATQLRGIRDALGVTYDELLQ